MPTRTPRMPSINGNGGANGHNVEARVAAAYRLIPEAGRAVGGIDADRQNIDIMLRGGDLAASELGWYFWARIPELRYITRYVSNSCSMARLFIGRTGDDPQNPSPVGPRHPANQLLDNWGGGLLGQAQIIDRLATFLTVTGDCILAGPKEGASTPINPFNRWGVFSTTEVVSRNGDLWYRTPSGRQEPVPPNVDPIRVWRPHPRLWWEADSPARSCYSVLREIDLLDQHVHATAVSRLAGAGLLAIPDELTIPGDEVETEGIDTDPFVKTLTEVMSLAIKNRESAAAIVPIILRGPGEYINQIKHFDFATSFDERVTEYRQTALRRLALGMDVPPEIMLGTAEASHWGAWQIDESSLRVHIVPLLQLIVGALTEGWFRPAMEAIPLSAAQRDELKDLVVWFDISNLVIHPNVSQDAESVFDRFEINADTLRLRSGFTNGDAPTRPEMVEQVLLKLVRDNNPTMVPYAIDALRTLGYPFPDAKPVKSAVPTGNIIDDQGNIIPAPANAAPVPEGRPAVTGPPTQKAPGRQVTPGQRSQDKQTSPPPAPPASGDGNRNG